MAWRNRRRPPGQPNPGGGGTPKLAVQTHSWSTWLLSGYWYVRYSVKVTRGLRLISNCRVQFLVSGTDEGAEVLTGNDGCATHVYEDVDPAIKALVVGARIFDPDTNQPIDIRCAETVPLEQQTVSTAVATKLRLGDEPSAEWRQTFPIFVYYDDKDGKPVPVKEAEVKAEVLGEEYTATSNENGYARLTLWIPEKTAWVTFSCGTYRERRRIRGHSYHGRFLLPPTGQPPEADAPWLVRAIYDLKLGANDGLQYVSEGVSSAYDTAEDIVASIPEPVRAFINRSRWLRLTASVATLALPSFIVFFLLTWWLGLGWIIYFTLAGVSALAFYFSTQFRYSVGWLCGGLNDRRLALLVLLLALSCIQVYRLPWGRGIIDGLTEKAIITTTTPSKPNTPLKRVLSYWMGEEERKSKDTMAKPATLTKVGKRSKQRQLFLAFLTLLGTLIYTWRAKADDVRAAWEDYQLDKHHRADVETARKKGEAPPSRPEGLSPFQHSLWVLLLAFLADFVFERLPSWLRGLTKESIQPQQR